MLVAIDDNDGAPTLALENKVADRRWALQTRLESHEIRFRSHVIRYRDANKVVLLVVREIRPVVIIVDIATFSVSLSPASRPSPVLHHLRRHSHRHVYHQRSLAGTPQIVTRVASEKPLHQIARLRWLCTLLVTCSISKTSLLRVFAL